ICEYVLPVPCSPTCRPVARTTWTVAIPAAHATQEPRARRVARPPYPALPVRVARALTAGNAPSAALPGRRRAAHLHPAHGAVAEFGVEPPDERRREQPDLSRPGGRV